MVGGKKRRNKSPRTDEGRDYRSRGKTRDGAKDGGDNAKGGNNTDGRLTMRCSLSPAQIGVYGVEKEENKPRFWGGGRLRKQTRSV